MAARRTRSRTSRAQREFVAEAEETLERMRGDLLELTERPEQAGEVDPELVNRLFRSAHSLKGLSGLSGLDALGELSHRAEDLLDALRMGRRSPDGTLLALLEEAVSLYAEALAGMGQDRDDGLDACLRELAARLAEAGREPSGPPAATGLDLDDAVQRSLTEYEEHRLQENLRRGRHIHRVALAFPLATFEDGLREVAEAVRETGEVVSTLPSGGAGESELRFTLLVASDLAADALGARLELAPGSVHQVGRGGAPPLVRATPEAPPRDYDALRSIGGTVRVDIHKLDELMNLVGELVWHRGALESMAQRLSAAPGTARLGRELAKIHKSLERRLQDLQTRVLDVRMVPLRQVFEKLSRVARRLGRDLDKDVRLELRGADTELDKLIVEELVDPLVHLVRNAFDHAIETPAERLAAGKPRAGLIRIEAEQRGNHVVIAVVDDGRGIDAERVRVRAEALGRIAPGAVPSRAELLALLFTPGFSTREQVTETSGRGVGMDVVRANLSDLGGVVEIESEPGHGTRVALTLPITLAIMQALLVSVGGQPFAIPLASVLETLLLEPGQLQRSQGQELLRLRGEPLPLRRLAGVFGARAASGTDRAFVVVVGIGEVRAGLVVDTLEGQSDMVIKPIQGPVAQVPGVAGASELGERGPVLVLDVASLVEGLGRPREAA